jgi:hypothetical protein
MRTCQMMASVVALCSPVDTNGRWPITIASVVCGGMCTVPQLTAKIATASVASAASAYVGSRLLHVASAGSARAESVVRALRGRASCIATGTSAGRPRQLLSASTKRGATMLSG